MERGVEGGLHRDGVHVDHPAAAAAQLLDRVHVGRRVHAQDLIPARARRLDKLQPQPLARLERGLDRPQPLRVLGMDAGFVRERRRMADVEAHGYRSRALPTPPPTSSWDVAVVGGGAAGLYTALAAADAGARVCVVSRKPLSESASFRAQGTPPRRSPRTTHPSATRMTP